jgi:hypothetical protein
MRRWFFANYEDPAENTPYEGEYVYIWGGPYDAQEELSQEFGDIVSDKVIEDLASQLSDLSPEWSGIPDDSDLDESLFDSIAESSAQLQGFESSISNVERLLELTLDAPDEQLLLRLLYVNVITSLETYLSDVFISALGADPALLRKFVETNPDFQSEKLSWSEVFSAAERIEKKAKAYLVDVVWHHLHKVKPMFRATLGIDFPANSTALFKAIYSP